MVEGFVASARPWAEILGFIKDFVLAAAVVYGVRQVILAKQTVDLARQQQVEDAKRARDQHERAAKTVTLEYASRFANGFGEKYVSYLNQAAALGIPAYGGKTGDFKLSSLDVSSRTLALRRNQLPACAAALDELEVFAAAHLLGVADAETGFKLNGHMFCLIVSQDFYDVLCFEREQGNFSSIVELFQSWSPRLQREKLTKSKELIDLEREEIELRKAQLERQMELESAAVEERKAALEKELASLTEAPSVRPIGSR